jgi:O-antigen/teichoic acid export membrane protein
MTRQVSRNAVINVIGVILPVLVGIGSVPILLANLGEARVGFFMLALGLVGFAGIFDLGLGRALTQTVASATGKAPPAGAIAAVVRRTLVIVTILGGAWGVVLWLAARPLATGAFDLGLPLAGEATTGIRWLAVAIPVLLLSSGAIGALEGLQRFALVNAIRIPVGIATFLVPALVSFWYRDVGQVIAALVLVRFAAVLLWLPALAYVLPITRLYRGKRIETGNMWRFSGWLTLSNVVGPLMVQADRYYLATLFPPAVIAYYTVPLDTLVRGTALPVAAMNAVFPAFANAGTNNRETGNLVARAGQALLLLWGLPVLVIASALLPLLEAWVGADFGARSLEVAAWLLPGVLANGFAHVPYALLQSAGRADITGKLHVIELPLYAVLLVSLTSAYGILGAAIAWTARAGLDSLILYALAWRKFVRLRSSIVAAARSMLLAAAVLLVILVFRSY